MSNSRKREKEQPPNAKAVNPRYGTTTPEDMARILTRPKSPEARAVVEKLQGEAGRSVTRVERKE